MPLFPWRHLWILAIIGGIFALWLTWCGYPVAGVDDALFKSPAAELVQHGRFAAPSLIGWFPRSDEIFAAYPLGYGGLFAGWYAIFGVSLTSSLALSHLLHVFVAILAAAVAHKLLSSGSISPRFTATVSTWIGLTHLSQLGQFDRPEEAAMMGIWLEFLLIPPPTQRRWIHWAASGLLIGAAAMFSPWVGVMGSLWLGFRSLGDLVAAPRPQRLRLAIGLGLSALLVAGQLVLWFALMEATHPGAVQAQLFGLGDNLVKYQVQGEIGDRLQRFWMWTLNSNRPRALMACLLFIVPPLSQLFFCKTESRREGAFLWVTGVLSILLIILIRPSAYTYFHASYSLLLPTLAMPVAQLLEAMNGRRRWIVYAGLCGLLLLTSKTALKASLAGVTTPPPERYTECERTLREWIPEGAVVACGPVHWHVFQNRNPWYDMMFSLAWNDDLLEQCDWLVFSRSGGRSPESLDLSRFERVAEVPSRADPTFSYGYILWKRTSRQPPESVNEAEPASP